MEISDKLALEFHTILLSHALILTMLISFTSYVFFRAKKSDLLYSYLSVVGMIALWLTSKILKTLSPVIELRWLFIVIQYFAIDCLGICLLIFAYIYRKDKRPSKRLLILWGLLPAIAFICVITNPYHMKFYAYFDIYKDRFGPIFYLSQSIQYLYLISGIFLLSHDFTVQPGFQGNRNLGRLFAVFVLLPLIANAYYILFKIGIFHWVFPFPVFDFTPIAAAISLMLFIVPTLAFRFFDIAPISLGKLYEIVPQGLLYMDSNSMLYGANSTLISLFSLTKSPVSWSSFESESCWLSEDITKSLIAFSRQENEFELELTLVDNRHIKVEKHPKKNGHCLFCFTDISEIVLTQHLLAEQNRELEAVNEKLVHMADTKKALAIAQTKAQMAQNVHDILGHSLTVVIGTAELASGDPPSEAIKKADQIEELLTSSLNDIKNVHYGKGALPSETTLLKAIEYLKNDNIDIQIEVQGQAYELNTQQTEAVYRLAQEAVTNAIKHGKAKKIHMFLRFYPNQVELYILDNGTGCVHIEKNFGLLGMEARFSALLGEVSFASDGESGFTIHATLPRQSRV